MSPDLPSDWSRVALADLIASLDAGVSVNSEGRQCDVGEIGVLKTSCVSGGRFNPAEHKAVLNGERGRVRVPVSANSIILSRMNTPDLVGENAYVEADSPDLFLPDRLWLLKASDRADCRWLSCFMQSQLFRRQLNDIATGTSGSMKNISKARLAELSLSIPPLDEQRRIAAVLRSADEAVSTAQAVYEQSLVVKQRAIDALCHGANEDATLEQDALPDGWRMVQLADVLAGMRYGTSAKCDSSPQGGLPVLRIPNVVKGRLDFDDLKFADVSEADARRFGLQDGDIVLVRTNGNPAYIGRNALVSGVSSPLLFASYLIRLRCDHDSVSAAFIHAAFNSTRVRSNLLRSATTSAGNYNINTESLRTLTISLPPLPEQRRIADTIAAMSATCDVHEHDFGLKRYLRDNLASDLISGRVRVPA